MRVDCIQAGHEMLVLRWLGSTAVEKDPRKFHQIDLSKKNIKPKTE